MYQFKNIIYKIFKLIEKASHSKQFSLIKNKNEIHFIIVITAFNNKKYISNCLSSVINQNYKNFSILYIDDSSTDGASLIAKKTLSTIKNAQLILNNSRLGKLNNLHREIHKLNNDSIIIELDGDDYLIDENVLSHFNQIYQKTGCLCAHANYINIPKDIVKKLNLGHFSQETPFFVKKLKCYRKFPWIYSGLRSYKAQLFKNIKKEDLLSNFEPYKNKFIPIFHDGATFLPILEMSGEKIGYIKKPMLLRNIDSNINDFKIHNDKIKKLAHKQVLETKKYEALI